MSINIFNELDKKLAKESGKGIIQACAIMHRDEIVYENYQNNKTSMKKHPIRSCTKSIISMLIGMCIRDGYLGNLDTPVYEYFPFYQKYFDEDRRKITIKHLLTMTPGFDWPEFGEWNYFAPMEFSNDTVKFILQRDIIHEPGTHMEYNSGCSNLLSYIIQDATGMKAVDYADKYLFKPLGITDYRWQEKKGVTIGAMGLNIKVTDMLKLGTLYLHNGEWDGKQIVKESWITESTSQKFVTYDFIGGYGYHWWTADYKSINGEDIPYYFAMGVYGQFIIVVPNYQLVTAFISENYSDNFKPMLLFRELVLPFYDTIQ